MFKKKKKIELFEEGFNYGKQLYKYELVKNVFFTIITTVQKVNMVKQGEAMSSQLYITFDSGKSLNIEIDEASILFGLNFNKKKDINNLFDVYQEISARTFQIRMSKYLSELKKWKFFTYDKSKFYPQEQKIVFRKKTFYVKDCNFLKSKFYVEIRKKQFTTLDKVKRELSLSKIPQFNTQTDSDIIFILLKEFFEIEWE